MSEDRWRDGYQAATRYHRYRALLTDRAVGAWTDPDKTQVRGLIRKHHPALAAALDDLEEASTAGVPTHVCDPVDCPCEGSAP